MPLSVWADTARRAGAIQQAQPIIWRIESALASETLTDPDQLPPSEPDGG